LSTAELLTIEEAARRIRMSVRHVRRLIAEGAIAHHRLGRSIRFHPADLEAYLAANRVGPIRDEAPAGATAGAFSLTSGSLNGMNTEDRS
jgi:excisionase family DNA binding protein